MLKTKSHKQPGKHHRAVSFREAFSRLKGPNSPRGYQKSTWPVLYTHLAIGAKVMLTVDVSDGLINGARGTVQKMIKTGSEVTLVLVKFDHSQVSTTAIVQSQYCSQYPEAVQITRHEAVFFIEERKAAEASRR